MRLKEIFIPTKGTRVILIITFSVSSLAVTFAYFYYRSINKSEDPRITEARQLIYEYDKLSGHLNGIKWFYLLDSAYHIYQSFPDYRTSYENGLIFNNKCSALLLIAMYDSTIQDGEKRTLMDLSMQYCDSSISIYSTWMTEWGKLSADEIAHRISPHMKENDPVFKGFNFRRIFSRRVKNIITAQMETPRRLSVSLSNKGTIYRHLMEPDSALSCYQAALSLWKDNRVARSNMNVLQGGQPIKPSIIESLFPPDRNKE